MSLFRLPRAPYTACVACIPVPPLFGTCPNHVQAAREKAAREKVVQAKAAKEKAAQEKAAQEKAAQEQALSLTCTCPLERTCDAILHSLAWTVAIKPEPLPILCTCVRRNQLQTANVSVAFPVS